MAAIDFSGVTLPFNVTDLLTSAMGIVGLVGPFVLLGIAFMVAPRVWNAIKNAIGKSGAKA